MKKYNIFIIYLFKNRFDNYKYNNKIKTYTEKQNDM